MERRSFLKYFLVSLLGLGIRPESLEISPEDERREVFKKLSHYEIREEGGTLLVMITHPKGDRGCRLNRLAEEVWKLLDGKKSLTEISKILAKKYKRPLNELEEPLRSLVSGLEIAGAVEKVI